MTDLIRKTEILGGKLNSGIYFERQMVARGRITYLLFLQAQVGQQELSLVN